MNNINERFNYNYNEYNEEQALEPVNSGYIIGAKNKFGRGDSKRFLEVNPEGEGPQRLKNDNGIR